ncbi:MAG: rhodanese-like domain-containing protein [Chloroflexi bacterium]|nr:rhodanese-like domain-containing protein [Chloroflexota bacterium]
MRTQRRWFLLLGLLTALAALLVGCGEKTTFKKLTPPEAYQLIQQHKDDPNFVILDVRTPEEYRAGHIPGAQNLDFYAPDFQEKLSQLPKDKVYFIYCNSGNRSGQTFEMMKRMGFKEVYDLQGGIQAWYQGGYPITR